MTTTFRLSTVLMVGALFEPRLVEADDAVCKATDACEKSLEDVAGDAKKAAETPEFDKLRTPDSPAFSILGVSPSEVERPNAPRALVLALGAFANEAGTEFVVPDSLALEVNPYSLIEKNPDFRREEGLRTANLWRNLTLSLASASEDITDPMTMEKTSLPTKLSFGVRTRLLDAQSRSKECAAVLEKALEQLEPLSKATNDRIKALGSAKRDGLTPEQVKQQNDEYQKAREEQTKQMKLSVLATELESKCDQGKDAAEGLSIDVAFATSGHYADGKLRWKGGHHHMASAAWLSAGFQGENGSIVLLGRYRIEDTLDATDPLMYTRRQYADAGIRGLYAKEKYGASIEAVVRFRVAGEAFGDEDSVYTRFAVLADYKVSSSHWLNVTFGKDFGGAPNSADIFTLANLKWSFDSGRSVKKEAESKEDEAEEESEEESEENANDEAAPAAPAAETTPAATTPAPATTTPQ